MNEFKEESIGELSEMDEDIDELDEESIGWSQDEPVSSCEAPEPEAKPGSSGTSASLCRLCAARVVDPVYIYSEFGESMKLAHKINSCLSVKIRKTDHLPKQLCSTCVDKINWCEAFDAQCIEAEEALEAMLRDRRESFDLTEVVTREILSDEKSCPLCIEGHMQTSCLNETSSGGSPIDGILYESDVVIDSSDEEKALDDLDFPKENRDPNSIRLECLGSSEEYLKCGACMNLYHTRESLDDHKCKPNIQSTSRPYECKSCDATFAFEERLNFHTKFHNGAKELHCDICDINFAKELKLFYHYKRYHCENNAVSCLQCGKLLEGQRELRVHVCVDGKTRPHVCEVCNKGFSDGYTLKRHIVTHLPEKPYKCSECSKSFTQKSRLNKHVAGHGLVIEKTQNAWKCVECGETFDSRDRADEHAKKHAKNSIAQITVSKIYHCEFCNAYYVDAEILREHRTRHVAEKPYSCNDCATICKSFADAVPHWKEHATGFRVATLYLCDVCGKETKELSLLYKHKRKREHLTARRSENGENEAKYVCELCARGFGSIEDLRTHAREQCTKFPCDVCGSLLPSANSLLAHKRRHNGLRPYVCNICGKSYTQSSHMWTHKRFHMGVKPYACEYCDQRFTIKPDLADHTRKKHTRERPFKCDVCNKAFLTGSVFYQHRLIHRGDRRYKCTYCEKAFTRTEALNNHIKIHTGEKPHACDVCGRCFRQKGDMRKHRRTQHSVARDEFS